MWTGTHGVTDRLVNMHTCCELVVVCACCRLRAGTHVPLHGGERSALPPVLGFLTDREHKQVLCVVVPAETGENGATPRVQYIQSRVVTLARTSMVSDQDAWHTECVRILGNPIDDLSLYVE